MFWKKKKALPVSNGLPAATPASASMLAPAEMAGTALNPVVKNAKPKVFLIGLEKSTSDVLDEVGINATTGSFGTPYEVERSSSLQPLRDSTELSAYVEQEIIFVDLSLSIAPKAVGEISFAPDSRGVWIGCDRGFIDPRPVAAEQVREGFDRIRRAGGVVVVFASAKTQMQILTGIGGKGGLRHSEEVTWDEWSFLSDLQRIRVSPLLGEEISICEVQSPLGRALNEFIAGMHFECTVHPLYQSEKWLPLAKNKFGETVGLARIYPSSGAIFVLPQMREKSGFIKRLLTDVFPEMFPSLFPSIEKGRWTHLPEYELGTVLKLQAEGADAVERHEAEMRQIASAIEAARKSEEWLHDLLTQTGDPLVEAVVAGLRELGFSTVVDMDKIRDREHLDRREDLQIQEPDLTLVVDIKGISNFPSDEDAMQAFKHATLIMREQKRVDIFGLSIINHRRHLPPLQRDNAMPFRRELVDVALQNQQGLMTSWDLYRLVVNKRKHSWKTDDVKPVLRRHGRIEPIPEHYVPLGKVTEVWKHAFGVDIESFCVCVGDTVALEFEIYFEECTVASLQVGMDKRLQAMIGDKTGIAWPTSANRPKIGMRVFVAKALAGYVECTEQNS